MTKYNSKYFGEIDFNQLEEWYETEFKLNEETIEISITGSGKPKSIDKNGLQKIDTYI